MKKATLILMILAITSKIIGFGREIVLSYYYGASNVSDAFLISLTIPTVIFAFIGVAIKTTFMPMYSRIKNEKGIVEADHFTSNVINILIFFSLIIVIIVLLFSEQVVKLFASGFDGETLEMAVYFTKITIFAIFFMGIIYVSEGYLQLKNRFAVPALVGLPMSLILIITIFLSTRLGHGILAYGKIVAVIAQLCLIVPFMFIVGYRHSFVANIRDNDIRKVFNLALPVAAGTSVNQINKLVDRTIASQIAVGGISALNYASRLNSFIQSIFIMSVVTVLYASISKMEVNNDMVKFKKSITSSINGIIILVLPVVFGSMIFSREIVTLLFARGAFDSKALEMTSSALFFYSIGILGFGLREVLARGFYALQDTKTPMINASIGMTLNIILNLILSRYLGIGGLALATSVAAIFTTGLMFISLRKKIGGIGMKNTISIFLKIVVASSLMGVIAKLSFNKFTILFSQNVSLLIAICVGASTFFLIVSFMKIDDIDVIKNIIKKKIRKVIVKP
ncbi:murein biosynthesis integral membrane protein MurJ [Anoxynatronum sibiricum]|uniref:Probable lipid II flippase MurJ n=1 Tax=Anoxynatronum sibiricum TaxID=210623 RepID=A0ABU9VYH2_9CLOT